MVDQQAWGNEEYSIYSHDPYMEQPRQDIYWKLVGFLHMQRCCRGLYANLEYRRYDGQSWSASELIEGYRGDLGDLSKLETGRRGLRGFSIEELSHELYDVQWSIAMINDSATADDISTEKAIARAIDMPPLENELFDETIDDDNKKPSHVIGYLFDIADRMNKIVNPPNASYVCSPEEKKERLMDCTTDGVRAVVLLADLYGIDLEECIPHNNLELVRHIGSVLEPKRKLREILTAPFLGRLADWRRHMKYGKELDEVRRRMAFYETGSMPERPRRWMSFFPRKYGNGK